MFSPMTIALVVSAATLVGSSLLPLQAQQAASTTIRQWGFDPGMLVADSRELLLRAPDPAIDRLFQAAHAATRSPQEAAALCELFDPAADRSLAGLNAVANRLSPVNRERFAGAVANLFVAAMQSTPQRYDEARARQALKASGVRAALVNDGFIAGLNGDDHDARCRALGWLMDDLGAQPLPQRAEVARLLLGEGLDQLALGPASPSPSQAPRL
ncbi:MAG: hypothetical protein ACOH1P_06090 [Lysobacter sp.]